METWLPIVLQLVAGAIGGNVAGGNAKKAMGTTLTTVLGALGGVGGGQLLDVAGVGSGAATSLTSIVSDLLGGAGGGAIVGVLAGMLGGGGKRG
jgi:hypothetical protein